MNGYLLVARTSIYDLPLRFFSSKGALMDWLKSVECLDDEINRIADLHDWPTSELLRFEAIKFRHGTPVKVDNVLEVENAES